MKNLLKNVFSIKNEGVHKVVKICGLKLKVKNKYNRIIKIIKSLKENQKIAEDKYDQIIKSINENKKLEEDLFRKLKSQQNSINKLNFLLTNGINKEQLSYDISTKLDDITCDNIKPGKLISKEDIKPVFLRVDSEFADKSKK